MRKRYPDTLNSPSPLVIPCISGSQGYNHPPTVDLSVRAGVFLIFVVDYSRNTLISCCFELGKRDL
jgi:hypothetical protein